METILKTLLIFSFAFSILFKLLNYLTFYRLYKAGGNMAGSNSDIIKQIKRRFSDCISLGKPVENTESFIRRLLLSSDRYNATGSFKEKLSIGFLLVFLGTLWFGYINGFFSYENTVLATVASMVLIYITDRIFDTCAVESGFITYAADYLDNTMKGRLLKSGSHLQRAQSGSFREQTLTQEKPQKNNVNYHENSRDKASENSRNADDYDSSIPEMAAASDTELITSIIDEFIL